MKNCFSGFLLLKPTFRFRLAFEAFKAAKKKKNNLLAFDLTV